MKKKPLPKLKKLSPLKAALADNRWLRNEIACRDVTLARLRPELDAAREHIAKQSRTVSVLRGAVFKQLLGLDTEQLRLLELALERVKPARVDGPVHVELEIE